MKAFDYAIAENEAGALAALAKGYQIKAAGIDILDMLKERTTKKDKYVSVLGLKGLKGITEKEGGIAIGALTTLDEIAKSDLLRQRYPALVDSIESAATPQLRAVATVAGNILQRPRCWYFRHQEYNCLKKGGGTCYAVEGDNTYHAIFGEGPCHIIHPSNIAPTFVAALAVIKTVTAKGPKTHNADEFFLLPAKSIYAENALSEEELVTEIFLPKLPEKSAYVEFKEKQSFDWPLAACTAVRLDGKWGIVLSHVAPVPWRAKGAEELLGSAADVTTDLAEKVADAAVADAAPMTHNGFRVKLARAAVRRAVLKACNKEIV